MFTTEEKNAIRMNLLFNVESGEKRSKILRVASALSEGAENEDDVYLSSVYYLSLPENEKELEEIFSQVGSWLPDIEEGVPAPKSRSGRKRGPRVRRVKK